VYEAADMFSELEAQARETEARAKSMCNTAAERLRLAVTRMESAERSRRDIITEADCKLQDASKALRQADLQIIAAEDKATAAEVRAQVAEARARELIDQLALVEEAIRRRLLCAGPATNPGSSSAVA
jgi:septation ring formation regulator EzrA